jgi:hypothetical protein
MGDCASRCTQLVLAQLIQVAMTLYYFLISCTGFEWLAHCTKCPNYEDFFAFVHSNMVLLLLMKFDETSHYKLELIGNREFKQRIIIQEYTQNNAV